MAHIWFAAIRSIEKLQGRELSWLRWQTRSAQEPTKCSNPCLDSLLRNVGKTQAELQKQARVRSFSNEIAKDLAEVNIGAAGLQARCKSSTSSGTRFARYLPNVRWSFTKLIVRQFCQNLVGCGLAETREGCRLRRRPLCDFGASSTVLFPWVQIVKRMGALKLTRKARTKFNE